MKKMLLAAICIAALAHHAPAEGTGLVIDPLADGITVAAGLGAVLGTELWLSANPAETPLPSPGDRADLPWLDGLACYPYDEGLSHASLATLGLGLALPATLALSCDSSELLTAAICYSEALVWTFAAKNVMKALVHKARPYTYYGTPPAGELLDEAEESFPSGHTSLAFCSATAFTALILELSPDGPETPWLVGGAYALATATGALRVASGNHFVGDAIAGAVLGSAIGYLTVKLHARGSSVEGGPVARLQIRGGGMPILVMRFALP